MKGSAGWVVLGIVVVFVLFMLVRLFYQDAVVYKLKHQHIVFGEVEVLRTKNTLLLAEKSLNVTWNLSSLRQIFDGGQSGFGSEFWYKINPADRSQIGKIPSNDEIKAYLASLSKSYKGFDSVDEVDGIKLRSSVTLVFTLQDSKIIVQVLGTLKAFAGDERKPTTESPKRVDNTYSFLIQLKKLLDAGKLFTQTAENVKIPAYSSNSNTYKSQAENSIKNTFEGISTDLEKKFTVETSGLLVATSTEAGILPPLSGLLFHYIIKGQFSEREALYHYLDENKFEKKPFSVTVKAEDYLVALSCTENNGKLFTFSSANDMACDGGRIYSCDTDITGIGSNKLTCGGRAGDFGCGESKFKDSKAVDESQCYCTAFGGNWIEKKWTCPEEKESAVPIDGWTCVPIETKYQCTGDKCPAEADKPIEGCDCKEKITKYRCTRDVRDGCSECTLGSTVCSVPKGCKAV